MKVYGKSDQAILAAVGEPFAIELESLPGAGYVWNLHVKGQALHLVKTEHEVPSWIGGAVVDRFTFEPVAPGEALIVAELKRPWESTVLERVTFHVSVEAAPEAKPS